MPAKSEKTDFKAATGTVNIWIREKTIDMINKENKGRPDRSDKKGTGIKRENNDRQDRKNKPGRDGKTDRTDKIGKTDGDIKKTEDLLCPYFKKCGGCRYLDRSYEDQLKAKQGIVAKCLKDISASAGIKPETIVRADSPFNYRNKVHSVFSRNGEGKIVRGIYREDTHRVVNVKGCLIEDKLADSIIEEVKKLLPSFKYRVYDEDNGTGWLRHVLVRVGQCAKASPVESYGGCGGDSGNTRELPQVSVMLVLVTATVPFTGKNNFIKAIREKFPQITTVIQNINDKRTSMVLGERNIVCYGPGYIEDSLMGLNFRISPSAFYQVNHAQAERLYSLAHEMASPSKSDVVVDAYCGTGTIGMCMAASAGEVVGVELNGDAVKDAVFNAKRNGIDNIRFIKADATEWMTSYLQNCRERDAKILIMDPPRAGSTTEFIAAASAMAFKRIVYVSCNPETLARDLKQFMKKGYKPERIVPVDMFPWTEHVETVCLLVLRNDITHINIDVDVEELVRDKRGQATYDQIRDFVKEQTGLHVSNLNIAQIKQKCGIIERENYNLPKSEDARQPACTKEKEEVIINAFRHFGLIGYDTI